METYLFTWNPKRWDWKPTKRWATKSLQIKKGDRAFLMRLGKKPKGIIGAGTVTSLPYEGPPWDKARVGETVHFVDIKFEFDPDPEKPILGEDLLKGIEHNWFPMASGTHIPDPIAEELEDLWSEFSGR